MSVATSKTEPAPTPTAHTADVPTPARGVVTLTCPERPGIVQAVSSFLLKHELNIIEHHQFDDSVRELLFLRTAFAAPHPFNVANLTEEFASTAARFEMNYAFHDETKPRLLVMASKLGHCLNDLIFRWRAGTLGGEIALVVSNHEDLRRMAEAADAWPGRRGLPSCDHAVRVENVLLRGTLVELAVALRRLVETDGDGVDGLRNVRLVRQDQIHQLPVVPLDRALTSGELVRLRPPKTQPHSDLTNLRILIHRPRITGHIQTRYAQRGSRPGHRHHVVQHRRRGLAGARAMPASLEPHRIHGRVHLRLADDVGNQIRQVFARTQVDGLTAETPAGTSG